MSAPFTRLCLRLLTLLVGFGLGGFLRASDHADPILLRQPERGLTGLFVFENESKDALVVILTLRAALLDKPPYDFEPYHYKIHFDLDSQWGGGHAGDTQRYGGSVKRPEQIAPELSLQFRLTDQGELESVELEGADKSLLRQQWAGLCDDPFIQPRFQGKNVVAFVCELDKEQLFSREGTEYTRLLVWANTYKGDQQLDHVGRANRTMQPRFEPLNRLQPSEHVAELYRLRDHPSLVEDIASTIVTPLFALREYDFVPDVLYYDTRKPVGYPNGRLLTDDVSKLTNDYGESLLWEMGWAGMHTLERPTENDKEFSPEFPYLAEPWPLSEDTPIPALRTATKLKIAGLILLVLVLFVLPWALFLLSQKELRRIAPPPSKS